MKAILKASIGLAAILIANGSMAEAPGKSKDLGVLPTVIAAGVIDPNGKVPAINGVPGAGVDNLDLAFPQVVLVHGQFYTYVFGTQNTTYSGTCSWSFTLKQGKKTLDSGTLEKSHACTPGQYYAWLLNGKAIPNAPGLATLTGTVTFDGKKATLSVTVRIV